MNEILPGVWHWTRTHPRIGIPVSSYWLAQEAVLLDPLVPEEGLDAFAANPPKDAILTNRHHHRGCAEFRDAFGTRVWCVEQGVHEFAAGQEVTSFRFGDRLPGDIEAIEIGALCPDEGAFFLPRHSALAVADGVVRDADGPLAFVPDSLLGDDPEGVKRGLRAAYREVVDLDFDHLLLAHGHPWLRGGRKALRAFIAAG